MGQPVVPPTPAGTTLAGKTVLVTGANTGLGFEAARQYLVLQAARVIITVRSASKGEAAIAALRADPEVQKSNPSAIFEYMELDLDDYQSGIAFANRVRASVPQLDILLLNGGVVLLKYERSASGHEKVMQVNCYTNFLIALSLLPLLQETSKKRGTPSHLTFTGSLMHKQTSLADGTLSSPSVIAHFDDQRNFSLKKSYPDSKFLVAAFVRELASRTSSSEVIINHLCPGLVRTNLDQNLPILLKGFMWAYRRMSARSPEEGARTLIHATAVAGKESHGEFLQHSKVDSAAEIFGQEKGKDISAKLWREVVDECSSLDASLNRFV